MNIAIYEPAVVQLLLVGGAGASPALAARRAAFRERLVNSWQRPLDQALDRQVIAPQNTRRAAEALAGAFDEVVLNVLAQPMPESEGAAAIHDMSELALRALGYSDE
jgi:hypothetical protein